MLDKKIHKTGEASIEKQALATEKYLDQLLNEAKELRKQCEERLKKDDLAKQKKNTTTP